MNVKCHVVHKIVLYAFEEELLQSAIGPCRRSRTGFFLVQLIGCIKIKIN